MPAMDSESTSTEDAPALTDKEKGEEGSGTGTPISEPLPSSDPPTTIPSSSPLLLASATPSLTDETTMESRAASMASNECSTALSSPTEASPAKPSLTPPTTTASCDGTVETTPTTSHIASASDTLTPTGTSLVNISESPSPTLPISQSTRFGGGDGEEDFPNVLSFEGISVTLENHSVWMKFYNLGTEMILTKPGRRMFPYCRYRLSGLNPDQLYSLVLSIVPSGQYRYRWGATKWEITSPAEHQAQGLIRAFAHHYSPSRGSDWMSTLVSFYKLKLTNNPQDQDGHIILNSMHRYIPRIHVIPVPDGDVFSPDKPVVMGPESMTFTFPQTEFMAVTTYHNFRITQLKINHNPFAKGFREDGNNPRLNRGNTGVHPVVNLDAQSSVLICAESKTKTDTENKEVADLSIEKETVSPPVPNEQPIRLVLKPIMSTTAKDIPYVPCLRGNHSLGDLVLVEKPAEPVEPKEGSNNESVTLKAQQGFRYTPKTKSRTPAFKTSTRRSSLRYRKKRKKINRRWANSQAKLWKAAAAPPPVVHSPSLTVAMQPELDDVEGLLFVSFTSKEALDVHSRDRPVSRPSFASPASQTTQRQTMEQIPEAYEERIASLEADLLQDLKVFKHKQVIHPVLQEVGMKLSSLDPTTSIDLQYLGVRLPLPPPSIPEQSTAKADGCLPFISRTGKTNDMTKIKGWRNKFVKRKEMSASCDGAQKNLSAFCSNMLDEYLESEAQNISERAAAFSTNPEGSVSYQLPSKSSSYVKTLDSVLKNRNNASRYPVDSKKPCPQKSFIQSDQMSLTPLDIPVSSVYAAAPSTPLSASQQEAALTAQTATESSYSNSVSPRLYHPGAYQRAAPTFWQNQGGSQRPPSFTKSQLNLMQMELGALKEGPHRTRLTTDRLSVALSALLTKEMQSCQISKVAKYPKKKAEASECGQDFCRLGCLCISVQHLVIRHGHCRRPECMLDCSCLKQTALGESKQEIQPGYAMTNMKHVVQPGLSSSANRLWKRNILDEDLDKLSAPKDAPFWAAAVKVQKRVSVPRPTQEIAEEDKDPVYRYLESMMTCARVRAFNSKPPPEVMEPKFPERLVPNTVAKAEATKTEDSHRAQIRLKKAGGKTSEENTSSEEEAKQQIEIQSACDWRKDSRMVLEALCNRMNQNKLSRRFKVGPYCISPIAKTFMRKQSGSVVTHKVRISKPSKVSDEHDGEIADSEDERPANDSFGPKIDANLENGQNEEMQIGVTPFLSRVTPAGILRARPKPVGLQANGLIQVNGKSYNQARVLLGNMGSLHPANRLAAYLTDRLHAPRDTTPKTSQKSEPTKNISTLCGLHIKSAGTVVPPMVTARKTTELKTPAQPPVKLFKPDFWKKASINSPQPSQNSSPFSNFQNFIRSQLSSSSPHPNSSVSSPVSLTVSPSLKTPSFLGQSGTYSFRICPPANQDTAGKKPAGVSLPGGFTLVQLPKPEAAKRSESVNFTTRTSVGGAQQQKAHMLSFLRPAAGPDAKWLGSILKEAKDLSKSRAAERGSFTRQMFEEKMRSAQSEKYKTRKTETLLDNTSEDLSSDYSDSCGEGDEDDELVDIETVEEARQGLIIARMKEALRKALQDPRDSREGFGLMTELAKSQLEDQINYGSKDNKRRTHTVLERLRRSEMRDLFDKLQCVLNSDPRAPRLRLLFLAAKEIQRLVENSKSLEEQKRRLEQEQSVYLKKLSILSGKPDDLIKCKLNEICNRQKKKEKTTKWQPFFSHLLQSKAALAAAPESEEMPLVQPNIFLDKEKLHPIIAAALQSIDKNPESFAQNGPLSACSTALLNLNAASPKAEKKPGKLEGQEETMGRMPQLQTAPKIQQHSSAATPQLTAEQNKAPPVPSTQTSQNPSAVPPKPINLPLIRSKTGRIILPASLKPLGQGFYTLMFMAPKEDGDEGKPSGVDTSKDKDKTSSESSNPPGLSCVSVADQIVTTQDSNLQNPSTVQSIQGENIIQKSVHVPLVDLKLTKDASTAAALQASQAAARVSFHRLPEIPPVKGSVQVPDPKPPAPPDPPALRRPRGRPRKNPIPIISPNQEHTSVVTIKSESETSVLLQEVKPENEHVEVTKTQHLDTPPSAKRSRGRPRKDKPIDMWKPPGARVRRTSSRSDEYSPVRFSSSFVSPEVKVKDEPDSLKDRGATRHLTRGSLGKDFPSAKKRSWIDLEKELDPELEFE